MLSRQVTLFREVQSFRLLALATVASAFGTWLAFVALTIDVYDRTGSAVWVSALLIADFLPAIVIGIAASSLVDRLPRRRLMIASDLAASRSSPCCRSQTSPDDRRARGGRRLRNGFFRPALYAGLPNLLPDEDLPHGNSCSRRSRTSPGPSAPSWEACSSPRRAPTARTGSMPSRSSSRRHSSQASRPAAAVGAGGRARLLARPDRRLQARQGFAGAPHRSRSVERRHAGDRRRQCRRGRPRQGHLRRGRLRLRPPRRRDRHGLALGSLLAGFQLEHRALATVYATSIGLVAVGMVERRPRRTSGSPRCRSRWPAPATAPRSSATRSSSSGARRRAPRPRVHAAHELQLRRARDRDDRRRAAHERARPEDRLGHWRRPRRSRRSSGSCSPGSRDGPRPAEAPAAEREAVETARL